jgi:hypothetical protein
VSVLAVSVWEGFVVLLSVLVRVLSDVEPVPAELQAVPIRHRIMAAMKMFFLFIIIIF